MEIYAYPLDNVAETARIYMAYRQCYHAGCVANLEEEKSLEEMGTFISNNIRKGHLSPLEHVQVSFIIEGVSRVTTHQLVRHRIASYSQQSQRYCKVNTDCIVLPKSVQTYFAKHPEKYDNLKRVLADYHTMMASGIVREDARYILPEGMSSCIVMTMNLRSLLHFFNERLCGSAQWEIREMAGKIAEATVNTFPWLKEFIAPKCGHGSECADGKSKLCKEHTKWM